jgi:hypothetical protein
MAPSLAATFMVAARFPAAAGGGCRLMCWIRKRIYDLFLEVCRYITGTQKVVESSDAMAGK